jgi:hypothetical protein
MKTPLCPVARVQAPRRHRLALGLVALCGCFSPAALATETGTTAFPNGGEDFLVGAMPPPGWYGLVYLNRYDAHRIDDGGGRPAAVDFDFSVSAATLRLDWVKPASIAGADRWGTLLVLPYLDLDLSLQPAPSQHLHDARRGFADLTIGNGLHWTFSQFEMIQSFDIVAPTGRYDAHRLVNAGRNAWVFRLNHIGTWRPASRWEVSYRFHWDKNFRNPDTDYRSGQTLYLNWAAGWKPAPPTTIGLTGFSLRQITDDTQHGSRVGPDGNRVRVSGIGVGVKHFLPNHVSLTAKFYRDFDVRNHPRGEQFWFYVAVPLAAFTR